MCQAQLWPCPTPTIGLSKKSTRGGGGAWEGIFGSMWRGLFFRINGYNVSTSIFINKVLFIYLSTSHFILLLPAFYFVVEVSYYYIRLRLFIRLIILAEIDIVKIPSSCDSAPLPPSTCQIWYLPFVYCNVSIWCSLQAMTSWAVRISKMFVYKIFTNCSYIIFILDIPWCPVFE